MNNENRKAKGFIKKHSSKIKGIALIIGALVISEYIYRDGYVKGANAGVRIGFGKTIKWCDKNIEDIQLTEKVNTWMRK